MKKKYFKNIETRHIYKEAGDKFGFQYLKVTPWETGEDRRTNINELKKLKLEGKVVKLPFAKAHEELNTFVIVVAAVDIFLIKLSELLKLDVLWQKFRNIKLK